MRPQADREEESLVDVESDAPDAMDDGQTTPSSEGTPLLHNTDLPPDVAPDKKFRRLVVAMCTVLLFIVEVSVFIMAPPTQQIMEDIICRDRYPDHLLRMPSVEDDRCKNTDVQQTLAMVRSWSASGEMLIRTSFDLFDGDCADGHSSSGAGPLRNCRGQVWTKDRLVLVSLWLRASDGVDHDCL